VPAGGAGGGGPAAAAAGRALPARAGRAAARRRQPDAALFPLAGEPGRAGAVCLLTSDRRRRTGPWASCTARSSARWS